MTRRRTTFLAPARRTPAAELPPLSPHPAPSMTSLLVMSVAITILVLCTMFTAEVVLQHLGITTLISAFVVAEPASPAYVYNVVLIGIPIVGAILGSVFLAVFSVFGGRGEHPELAPVTGLAHPAPHAASHTTTTASAPSGQGLAMN